MTIWKTTIQAHPSGDGIVPMPADVVHDNDFRPGDVFMGETTDEGGLLLRRAVRLTRLIREWNKYQRRIERSGQTFVVLRNRESVAEIGPANQGDARSVWMHRP